MLLPRKVEELVITVPMSLYDAVVAKLASIGVFHVDEPPREKITGYVVRRYRGLLARISEKLSRVESYYKALGLEPQHVEGLELKAGGWEEAFEKIQEEYKSIEAAFEKGVQRLAAIESRVKELVLVKSILEMVKHVDADVRKAMDATRIAYTVGFVSGEPGDLEKIAGKVKDVVIAYEVVGEETIAVALAGTPASTRKALGELRKLKWMPLTIPMDLPGSPAQAYERVRELIEKLQEEADNIVKELSSMKRELDKYYTLLYALKEAARILANTLFTKTMAIFRGFIDKSDRKKIRDALNEASEGAFIILSLGVKRAAQRVPTKVELPKPIRPFHKLVRMFGEPDPDEIVPTVFMAITFPLFFALMFPDMGHGLLVLLFALWYFKKRDPDWRYILSVLGAASMVTGFLAGEFFGTLGAEKVGIIRFWESLGYEAPPLAQATFAVEKGLGYEVLRQLLFNIISIALWLAAFMLMLGTFLGIVDAWLKGDKLGAVLSKAPVFLFFTSATLPFFLIPDASKAGHVIQQAIFNKGGGGILPAIVFWGSIAAIIWKLLGEPIEYALEGESFLSGLGEALLEVYEMLLMVMGNIPSFLRILGLGLAHAGLMLGFTELYYLIAGASSIPYIVAISSAILVYAFGNLLVAGLEAIIAFAHSLRLHFYEWFSKFYHGTGRTFEPVRIPGVKIIIMKTA